MTRGGGGFGASPPASGRPRTDVLAGRFELDDPIASGGSGVVWRAHDNRLDRTCAAKLLRRRDGGELLRFAREQSVRLNHPHVLTPYAWAAEDEYVLIASELVEGGSLSRLLGDHGPLAEPTVAAVLDQLLDALAHVHGCGLVHRDVKPANVLLRVTGTGPLHLLLADFGLAIRPDDARLTGQGLVIGTPGYVPPEVQRTGAAPEPSHDLYALGRMAAALLTGMEPDRLGSPADLRGVRDPHLRALVADLAAPLPELRPPSAVAARARLRDVAVDANPRAIDGEHLDVLNQLPPVERTVPVMGGPPPWSAAVLALPRTPHSPTALHPPPTRPSTTPGAGPPTLLEQRHGGARRRRARVPGLVGVAAAVAAVVLAITSDNSPSSGAPGSTAPPSGTAASTSAASTSIPTAPVDTVVEGGVCTFLRENDTAPGADGLALTCRQVDGAYRWMR